MANVPAAGRARRSQLVTTYGIGSIIDLVSGSYMPLGLENIEKQSGRFLSQFKIAELRLQSLLKKSRFYGAIIPRADHVTEWGQRVEHPFALPVTRFPNWLECTNCHRLGKVGDPFEQDANNRVRCMACKGRSHVNPVRFVVACRRGHISDFPWVWWTHRGAEQKCGNPVLYLRSSGQSASLGDLYVRCGTCKSSESLSSIFVPGTVKVRCRGDRPWLLDSVHCDLDVEVVQRGGSNTYFPIVASMISIPPESDPLGQLLRDRPELLEVEGMVDPEAVDAFLQAFIQANGLDENAGTVRAVIREMKEKAGEPDGSSQIPSRYAEYRALSESNDPVPVSGTVPEFENHTMEPALPLAKWFDLIGAVNRLREVRVCCGFTRIVPYSISAEGVEASIRSGRVSSLSRGNTTWLPAAEVHGEGIFLRLRDDAVREWEKIESVRERADILDDMFTSHYTKIGEDIPYHINPRLLLVHSLAHILIRKLSLECGYSSSSLAERLYVSDTVGEPMCGLLIYTASSDSDGSLGGLVNLAKPHLLEPIVTAAIEEASWCGNDPVCIENSPRNSGERFSGASCHNCLLLPETACEKHNRELDRAMLTDLPDARTGFFSS